MPAPKLALPCYHWTQTYDWNYAHVPEPVWEQEPAVRGEWNFCGIPAASPLGIAAGPLLNGGWILYYASLGFDVLTYKTVRSRARPCYSMPNLQPVSCEHWHGGQMPLASQTEMLGSWAVSFGMPSKSPDIWRADIERTRHKLPKRKLLSVSIVATPDADWMLAEVAEDFARCARWAIDSGADSIEANFSCPNVASADAQLYQQPNDAAAVAKELRRTAGPNVPLLLKIGHVTSERSAAELSKAVAPFVDALVMVNCITAAISHEGQLLFNGERRGIAGKAIRNASLAQIDLFSQAIRKDNLQLRLVGVGGIASADDVRAHFANGCHSVQLATAAMLDPGIGFQIRTRI